MVLIQYSALTVLETLVSLQLKEKPLAFLLSLEKPCRDLRTFLSPSILSWQTLLSISLISPSPHSSSLETVLPLDSLLVRLYPLLSDLISLILRLALSLQIHSFPLLEPDSFPSLPLTPFSRKVGSSLPLLLEAALFPHQLAHSRRAHSSHPL